jgi:hypothetical protein
MNSETIIIPGQNENGSEDNAGQIEVTILIPCLDEIETVATHFRNCHRAIQFLAMESDKLRTIELIFVRAVGCLYRHALDSRFTTHLRHVFPGDAQPVRRSP